MAATASHVLYPELSYRIVGLLYDVYNEPGYGYKEKQYERAMAAALTQTGLSFKQQLYVPLYFKEEKIGEIYLDFLIEDIIVLELKRGSAFSKKSIEQVLEYLRMNKLRLGILAQFMPNGVKYKRIVNIQK